MIFVLGCSKNPITETDEIEIISTFTEHQMSIKDYSGIVLIKSDIRGSIPEQCKIYVRYPDKIKAEYIQSSIRHNGTVSILNGSILLEYDPVNNETILFETNPDGNSLTGLDYQGLLKKIISMGNISYSGVEYIDNIPVYLIDIRPEKPHEVFEQKYCEYRFSLARAWVDPELWIVKRIELYDSGGTRSVVTVNYQELSVNTGISENIFSSEQYLLYKIITPPTHPSHIY